MPHNAYINLIEKEDLLRGIVPPSIKIKLWPSEEIPKHPLLLPGNLTQSLIAWKGRIYKELTEEEIPTTLSEFKEYIAKSGRGSPSGYVVEEENRIYTDYELFKLSSE